jgi:hypothetical protein
MTVVCSPGLPALARIVAVLHARNADVRLLHFDTAPSDARLVVDVIDPDVGTLAARIRRLVDVSDVRVAGALPVAVAS